MVLRFVHLTTAGILPVPIFDRLGQNILRLNCGNSSKGDLVFVHGTMKSLVIALFACWKQSTSDTN